MRGKGKARGGYSRGGGKKATSQPVMRKVDASSLPWAAIPLPLEAQASGGQTEADFLQGLDFDDDDFMGLKEVEGVDVVKQDDGAMSFIVKGSAVAAGAVVQPKKSKKVGGPRDAEAQSSKKAKQTMGEMEDESAAALDRVEDGSDEKGSGGEGAVDGLPKIDWDNMLDGEESEEAAGEGEDGDEEDQITGAGKGQWGNELDVDFNLLAARGEEDGLAFDGEEVPRLAHWEKLNIDLDGRLKRALQSLEFDEPTKIQALALPYALQAPDARDGAASGSRDVVGIAQTGSGKTLSYGLPMLNWIAATEKEDRKIKHVEGQEAEDSEMTRLTGLVLAPTRELALQVSKHLEALIRASSPSAAKVWAHVATLTGGISEEKQRRLVLGHDGLGTDIIVATPGRLWDMCKSDDTLTRRIKLTRFLVVDEADRMIETGHFAEMENIFALVKRAKHLHRSSDYSATSTIAGGAPDMQTFIYSATLSKDLQNNLKKSKRKKRKAGASSSTIEDLISMIDFRDEDPHVIDLSTTMRLAERLVETKVECLAKDKDLYLYYFLQRYPGRTLVFLNSIDGIRRLTPLLSNLNLAINPLHSQLQQRQRLKNLERFQAVNLTSASGPTSSILLATDVAARGLDIPSVDHVVHFQLPRSADTYVHRSGRTARAGKSGLSVAMIEPSEKKLWGDLCRSLSKSVDINSLPVEYSFLPALRKRVDLAREIDRLQHQQEKESHDDSWLRKLAEEADMEMSGDEIDIDAPVKKRGGGGGNATNGSRRGKGSNTDAKVASLKSQLSSLLRTPLSARGVSHKYITSGSRDFVDSLLHNRQHNTMIGVKRSRAEDDVQEQEHSASKPKPLARKKKV